MPTSLRKYFLSAFVVFCFLGVTTLAHAQQWATTGNDIYNTNTGYLGIGTTAPTERLDVNGSQRIQAGNYLRLERFPNDYHWRIYNANGDSLKIENHRSDTGGLQVDAMTVQDNGNVGIGTTNPNSKLDVNGSILVPNGLASGYSARNVAGTGNVTMLMLDTGNNTILDSPSSGLLSLRTTGIERIRLTDATFNFMGGTLFANSNYGYVGIGTMAPTEKLDVNGSARIQGGNYLRLDRFPNDYHWRIYSTNGDSLKIENHRSDTGGLQVDAMTIQDNGNVGVGTTTPSSRLHVVGDVTVTGSISAKYQDIAEWVPAATPFMTGTVVILDTNHTNFVITSSEPYDTRVAGVVSSSPGLVLGEADINKVKVATTGRVRVRVDATRAPIRAGDLLVTSEKRGMAMRSEPVEVAGVRMHRPGTLIGKALEPQDSGEGEILVLLSLQ